MAGVTIGDGAVIGARALVTKRHTHPYTIVGGVPAKPIKKRFFWKTARNFTSNSMVGLVQKKYRSIFLPYQSGSIEQL